MLQNRRDPATPFAGALGMRGALAGRARMVTVDQGGHGVYLVTPDTCASDAATSFLVSGTLVDRFCAASPAGTALVTAGPTSQQLALRELARRMRGAA